MIQPFGRPPGSVNYATRDLDAQSRYANREWHNVEFLICIISEFQIVPTKCLQKRNHKDSKERGEDKRIPASNRCIRHSIYALVS